MRKEKEKMKTLKIPKDDWAQMFNLSFKISPNKEDLIKPYGIIKLALNVLEKVAEKQGIQILSEKEGAIKERAGKLLN